jgi:hypothetical protein
VRKPTETGGPLARARRQLVHWESYGND